MCYSVKKEKNKSKRLSFVGMINNGRNGLSFFYWDGIRVQPCPVVKYVCKFYQRKNKGLQRHP